MSTATELARRELDLLAQIERGRAQLLKQFATLRRPLRQVERVEQGFWTVNQRLRRVGGLRGLLLLVVPASVLVWRMRRWLRAGVRMWGLWQVVRGLGQADGRRRIGRRVRQDFRPRRWPLHLLRLASGWRP